jgi:hypothetical protein
MSEISQWSPGSVVDLAAGVLPVPRLRSGLMPQVRYHCSAQPPPAIREFREKEKEQEGALGGGGQKPRRSPNVLPLSPGCAFRSSKPAGNAFTSAYCLDSSDQHIADMERARLSKLLCRLPTV